MVGAQQFCMHNKVKDSINHATHQVIVAVVGAVIDAAAKAASPAPAAPQSQQASPGVQTA